MSRTPRKRTFNCGGSMPSGAPLIPNYESDDGRSRLTLSAALTNGGMRNALLAIVALCSGAVAIGPSGFQLVGKSPAAADAAMVRQAEEHTRQLNSLANSVQAIADQLAGSEPGRRVPAKRPRGPKSPASNQVNTLRTTAKRNDLAALHSWAKPAYRFTPGSVEGRR